MYQKRVLPNGVRIVSERAAHVRTASIGIWVGNGSRYEPAELSGVSHFIEHMLFKGTRRHSAKDLASIMDTLGGNANAFTDKECTCYYIKVLDEQFRDGIAVLSDMFFDSLFAESDLNLERGVVLEEIGMYEDAPESVATERLFERCYKSSSLGNPVLGTAQTLQNIDSAAMHAYRREYYRPKDTVVAVSGSFTEEDLDYIAELFAPMQGEGHNLISPASYEKSMFLAQKDIEQNHLCLSFPGLSLLSDERFALNLLQNILGGSMSSRLFQTVREENGLCYSVYSFLLSYLDTGLLSVYTGLSPDTEQKALSLILSEIDRIRTEGITQAELARARSQIKTSVYMALESTGSRMMSLGKSELMRGETMPADEIIHHYDIISADEVNSFARRIFQMDKLSLSVVGTPKDESVYRSLIG